MFRSSLAEARRALLEAQAEFEEADRTLSMVPVGESLKATDRRPR